MRLGNVQKILERLKTLSQAGHPADDVVGVAVAVAVAVAVVRAKLGQLTCCGRCPWPPSALAVFAGFCFVSRRSVHVSVSVAVAVGCAVSVALHCCCASASCSCPALKFLSMTMRALCLSLPLCQLSGATCRRRRHRLCSSFSYSFHCCTFSCSTFCSLSLAWCVVLICCSFNSFGSRLGFHQKRASSASSFHLQLLGYVRSGTLQLGDAHLQQQLLTPPYSCLTVIRDGHVTEIILGT